MLDDDFITEQLILGYSLPELAKIWEIDYKTLIDNYSVSKKNYKYFYDKIELTGKQEPYYQNEWQYGLVPKYNFNELSDTEIKFYYEIERNKTN